MIEKREVLDLVAGRSKQGKTTTFRTLMREFYLSQDAACSHLKRLWRDGLVRSDEVPPRRRLSLGPGESIRDLRFALSRRGRAWLDWSVRQEEESAEWFP